MTRPTTAMRRSTRSIGGHVTLACHPADGTPEQACATQILSRLARRAYRRPVIDEDVQTLLGFFETGRESGGSFDAGIQLALERLLVDPDFLLRIERDPDVAPGQVYPLSDLEVASRLVLLVEQYPRRPLAQHGGAGDAD